MGIAGGPDIIQDGLVLSLDASDRNSYVSGSSTWKDLSGSPSSGSLINGPTFSSNNGGTIIFDGTDDRVEVDYNSNLNLCNVSNWTISVWIKLTDLIGTFNCIIGQWPQNNDDAWLLSHDAGTVGFAWAPFTTNTNMFASNTPLVVNNWTNVVLVKNGSSFTLYQNTNQVGSATNSGTKSSSVKIELARYGNSASYLGGIYSSVNIQHIALSTTQILQNYNALKSRFNL